MGDEQCMIFSRSQTLSRCVSRFPFEKINEMQNYNAFHVCKIE